MTACAEILHYMLGIPYDKISNSEIYKKMLLSSKHKFDDFNLLVNLENLIVVRKSSSDTVYFTKFSKPAIQRILVME